MSRRVVESFVPLADAATLEDAHAAVSALARAEKNPERRYGGVVEARTLGDRMPRTTARYCAVVRTVRRG